MDKEVRKWRKHHHRCRNCEYLSRVRGGDYQCAIKGHTLYTSEVFRVDGLYVAGVFCRCYQPKEDKEDSNG